MTVYQNVMPSTSVTMTHMEGLITRGRLKKLVIFYVTSKILIKKIGFYKVTHLLNSLSVYIFFPTFQAFNRSS